MEVPGEDPYLSGQYALAYTQGLQQVKKWRIYVWLPNLIVLTRAHQGPDPRYLLAAVTLKHWDAYSLEDYENVTRHNFNAIVSNYDLATTYFPAFRTAVQEGQAMVLSIKLASQKYA